MLGNYLRVRGEYALTLSLDPEIAELPPRARRIHAGACHGGAGGGTTSACAENTRHDTRRPDPAGNYLRVRGEYHTVIEQ